MFTQPCGARPIDHEQVLDQDSEQAKADEEPFEKAKIALDADDEAKMSSRVSGLTEQAQIEVGVNKEER